MDLFDKLKASCVEEWSAYVNHSFVKQISDATLPLTAFQMYLVQDYLFLIQFARAYALAAYKSRTLVDLQAAQGGLEAILGETELHIRLCQRWGLTREQIEATSEHQATTAYTRFVLDCGMAGDLLDLHVALAPCVVGYAEIARNIASRDGFLLGSHPYREWIEEYLSPEYCASVTAAREYLDRLAARLMTKERFGEVCSIFAQASRLEAAFWQMALESAKSG